MGRWESISFCKDGGCFNSRAKHYSKQFCTRGTRGHELSTLQGFNIAKDNSQGPYAIQNIVYNNDSRGMSFIVALERNVQLYPTRALKRLSLPYHYNNGEQSTITTQ